MFHRPLAFFRLQKTQMRPGVGSNSTPGWRSGSTPVVSCLGVPQPLASRRLNQIFQVPDRRELQNNHKRLLESSNTAGSDSSTPLIPGGGTPKPIFAAADEEESTLTRAGSPGLEEVRTTLPACAEAAPGATWLIAAATSAAVA